jgi:hypothetical protein
MDWIHAMEMRSGNIVTLADLLNSMNRIFQKIVKERLALERFVMDGELPNLHHPKRILEAIEDFKVCGFELDFDSFRTYTANWANRHMVGPI